LSGSPQKAPGFAGGSLLVGKNGAKLREWKEGDALTRPLQQLFAESRTLHHLWRMTILPE
jgi:hypothetical protein